MIDKRRWICWLRPFALAWLALGSSGCTEELGPERMPVTRVKGKVSERGRPVQGGWVEFFPVDGTVGNLCSARLHADGSFEADHVAVGLNLIRLVNTDLKDPLMARHFGAYTTPIRRTIPDRPGDPLAIDVVDEWERFVDSRLQHASPDSQRTGEP